jgi:hypothetical protein
VSISYASSDSIATFSDGIASPYAQSSLASYSPIFEQSSSWSGSKLAAPPTQFTSAKGKQPAPIIDTGRPPFLSILFDREDYLRAISESEDEAEDDRDTDGYIDPRLLSQPNATHATGTSTNSPKESSRSRIASPQKEIVARSHGMTHLNNRQPMVNTIRVHPNFNLHNLFGNMPFSSSIRTNNYPSDVQDTQVNNLFLPTWAMMPVNTRPDPGSLKDAFYGLFRETTAMIESGVPVDVVIETHPNIAALFDEDEYNRSGVLSKWAAGMVHSAQLKGRLFTPTTIYQTIMIVFT